MQRSTDRDEGLLEVKEAEANEQHTSIIGALRAAAPTCHIRKTHFLNSNFLLITDVISVAYHIAIFVTIFVLFKIVIWGGSFSLL